MKRAIAVIGQEPRWLPPLFCLSAANLNFVPVMRELIFFDEASAYFTPVPTSADYLAILILNFGVAVLALAGLAALARLRPRIRQFGLLAFIAVLVVNPLNHVRYISGWSVPTTLVDTVLAAAIVVATGLMALRFRRAVVPALYLTVVILSPFAISNLAQATWHLVFPPDFGQPPPASYAGEPTSPRETNLQRVLWLTFDALDRRVLFTERPEGYDFPAFDAFRRQSIYASRVKPLGGPTLRAMPSAWLGRRVREARPAGAYVLEVRLDAGEDTRSIGTHPNLFTASAGLGAEVAIVGFYHAYCRLFIGSYSRCQSFSYGTTRARGSTDLASALAAQLRVMSPLWRRSVHLANYRFSHAAAMVAVADPAYDLVFVHVPVPHLPPIFDAAEDRPVPFSIGASYPGNVVLGDFYLRDVKEAMEAGGLWRDTTVLISSDHGQISPLTGDDVIPFMLKLPNQEQPATYGSEIDSIVFKDLVLSLLRGELRTVSEVAGWLDARS